MRVIIAGSRTWTDEQVIKDFIDRVGRDSTIITGGAIGADTIADTFARNRGMKVEKYAVSNVDWSRLGRKAGPLRNRHMLELGADYVLVFRSSADQESPGSDDMVRQAHVMGIPMVVIREEYVERAKRLL